LESVDESEILNNKSLVDLSALYNLQSVGCLVIKNNKSLTDQAAYDLVMAIGMENIGSFGISGNQ